MDSNVRGTNAATQATKDFTAALQGATNRLGPIGQFGIGAKAAMDGIMSGPLGSVIRALTGGLASGVGVRHSPGVGGSGIKNMTPGSGAAGSSPAGHRPWAAQRYSLGSAGADRRCTGAVSPVLLRVLRPTRLRIVVSHGWRFHRFSARRIRWWRFVPLAKRPTIHLPAAPGQGLQPSRCRSDSGNLEIESGFNPTRLETVGTAHGIAQWRGDRWANLKAFAKKSGRSEWDVGAEADFLGELSSYKGLNKMLL